MAKTSNLIITKYLPVLGTILALGAIGANCANADALDNIMKVKKIRIAIDPAAPPYSIKDSGTSFSGSEVEVAQLLASDFGVELEIVPTTPANRVPYLMTDKADLVISTLSITPEREKVIDFSKPYSGIQIVVGAPKNAPIKSLNDLVGKRVGTVRGSTNDAEVTKAAIAGTNIIRFDDDATTITALLSGQADAYATAPALLASVNRQNPPQPFEPKIVIKTNLTGIGLRKNEPALKEKINAWVQANIKNGKLNGIYKKYFLTDLPSEVSQAAGATN